MGRNAYGCVGCDCVLKVSGVSFRLMSVVLSSVIAVASASGSSGAGGVGQGTGGGDFVYRSMEILISPVPSCIRRFVLDVRKKR